MLVFQDVETPKNATVTLSNGKTLPVLFMVRTEADTSYDASEENPVIQEQIRRGYIQAVYLEVTASVPSLSTTGTGGLLGCLVGSREDIEGLLSMHDMFDEALADLKSTLEFELGTLLP